MHGTAAFLRAARRRREAAEILVCHNPSFRTDSVYLAGYAGECALKALLVETTPAKARSKLADEVFRGNRGHDILFLVRLLADRGLSWSRQIHFDLIRLAGWSTRLRYETTELSESTAIEFLNSVDRIVAWVEDRT